MKRRITLVVALALHAIAWLLVFGHQVTLNVNSSQTLFGVTISYGTSWVLTWTNGAILILTALVIVRIGMRELFLWLTSDPVVRPGVCKRCGYDMRGSTIQCPECGYVVERMSPAP